MGLFFCCSLDVDVGCAGVTGIGCGLNSGETECFTTYLGKVLGQMNQSHHHLLPY